MVLQSSGEAPDMRTEEEIIGHAVFLLRVPGTPYFSGDGRLFERALCFKNPV